MSRFVFITLLALGALGSSALHSAAFAIELNCAVDSSFVASAESGPLCMKGDRRALAIFVIFKDAVWNDAYLDSSDCRQWSERVFTLEPWMSDFLDNECSTPGSCPGTTTTCDALTSVTGTASEPSLTDYYYEMSGGKGIVPILVETRTRSAVL